MTDTSRFRVEAKILGQRKPLFSDWSVELPPGTSAGDGHCTLRALITQVVREEVRAYRERQEARRLARVLSREEIAVGVQSGKVDMGGARTDDPAAEPMPVNPVDTDEAVATALQAFGDGLYYVFVDETQRQDLEESVRVRPDSRVTFLRLVPLAGG